MLWHHLYPHSLARDYQITIYSLYNSLCTFVHLYSEMGSQNYYPTAGGAKDLVSSEHCEPQVYHFANEDLQLYKDPHLEQMGRACPGRSADDGTRGLHRR